LQCNVGTRLIQGIIKEEKEEVRKTYQAAVHQLEPASLLEQHAPDVFSTNLGNIPPGATVKVKVEIEYIMELNFYSV
jgi:Ca-activated chloride channel family protein